MPSQQATLVDPPQAARAAGSENDVWVSWTPGVKGGGSRGSGDSTTTSSELALRRRKVRAQASRSSAPQRKATMAERLQRQIRQSQSASPDNPRDVNRVLSQAKSLIMALETTAPMSKESVDFKNFVQVLHQLEDQARWLRETLDQTTLSQQAIRSLLGDAMTISPSLFQSTLFVSGTYSNTCGLAPSEVQLGVGMLFMRGSSLHAVNEALKAATEKEHWTSMAVALLAGWELQFGDKQTYEIHMEAWRQLFDAPPDLHENSISLLRDVAFETLRERLNQLSATISKATIQRALPPGFLVLGATRPETISLLSLTQQAMQYDLTTDNPPSHIRYLGLQTISWTPHHSDTLVPSPTFEGAWEQQELIALYHLRAALISIVALHSYHAHTLHNAVSYLDIMHATLIHAQSCQHLRTQSLIGTRYQSMALWARYVLCSISEVPGSETLLRHWLIGAGITTWEQISSLLRAHLFLGTFATSAHHLYLRLFGRLEVEAGLQTW
ncbi:hypothetical protein EJ05DRAFT_488830 [Pseudovirgaria hyperparasitica]|uniref:Transcription factor domain-containing protein n=1 Tax=Pseudovirgaria hyperparasitica TaxID=470096 RepID=A0A6A6VWX1_9PEZI|nr:uncharacterized protein EJ05DRAFT_488830 [Pseudovirgaria hyperparasitica]KAF2754665.1 hypothetical protein EJ05DRAFT_488830 [Pseudovirgaria hyperparasitica]